ncbi:MAG: hypothetical protein R3346_04225, partial [Candidatus Spechtbacterales bacterium]|nr:hypothetical protein [Candidatus Spechtbacterales bacterium]
MINVLYIKTKCPSCGIIRVKATDVKIHLKPENIPESVLLFRCSSCNQKLAAKPHNKKLLQD